MKQKQPIAGQPRKAGAGGSRSKLGRKTKLTPELTRAAAVLKENGATNEQLAKELGISETSVYEYQQKFPEFAQALKGGRAHAVAIVEGALFRRALGYTAEERHVTRTPKIDAKTKRRRFEITEERVVTKHVEPNVTAQALFLNNNAPERYSRSPEQRPASPAVVVFNFNIVDPATGQKKAIEWDPKKPLPASILPKV